ncbi:phosphoserine phosphatase SerB [Pontixanthobacter sp. CEM42]|uniref:phosphoserine phosphatase SerB n=1 Tax=Pontixanthobacter sp. CEM42 TaxID=2792077 RepID=UPI0032AEE898
MLITRLIADPDGLETRLKDAVSALKAAGMTDISGLGSRITGNGDAVLQMIVGDGDKPKLRQIIEEHFSPSAALFSDGDITIPSLFVSDMDSTMIEQECIDELADFAGLKDKVSDITERAMQGELDFEDALRERVALLKGLPESDITKCLNLKITDMHGARTLVQTLRAQGCKTVLVTGGFHHFADTVAERLGFDRVVGNRLGVAGGKLTGKLDGPIADSATKLSVLNEEREKIGSGAVLATGDGANDIPMIEAASYGIAYKAKPKARAASSGWIDRGDLTAILSLLGIQEYDWSV